MNDGVNDIKMAEEKAAAQRQPLDSALWALREYATMQRSVQAAHAYNEILKGAAAAGVRIQQQLITVAELATQ